jgi:uncharacterized membrane-anchored protein
MDNKKIIYLAILFQVLVLVGMFVKALHPLLTGQEIELKIVTKDPRDFFSGDYVILNYDFNSLDLAETPNDLDTTRTYTYGDALYLELEKKGQFYEPVGLWQNEKDNGNVFMRTIVENSYEGSSNYKMIYLKAGIEKYFTESQNAKQLDVLTSWANRDAFEVSVSIMVSSSGVARIKEIKYQEKKT